MKKIFLIVLFLINTSIFAQTTSNPFNQLSRSLFENELLSNRFLRNFVLVKTNTYKQRALKDMDQSLAKFDDNLSYIILHIPEGQDKAQNDFMKLQNFWNVYRMYITDYQNSNYNSLVRKTIQLDRLTTDLKKTILEDHPAYKRNSGTVKTIGLMLYNAKKIDQLLTSYILIDGLKFEKASSYYNTDFSELFKNLKKISKYKYRTKDVNEIITDLQNSLNMIASLIEKGSYNPKTLFSNANTYSKKTFLLLSAFMSTVKN